MVAAFSLRKPSASTANPSMKQYSSGTFSDRKQAKYIGNTIDKTLYEAQDFIWLVFSLLELDEDRKKEGRLHNVRQRLTEGHFLR